MTKQKFKDIETEYENNKIIIESSFKEIIDDDKTEVGYLMLKTLNEIEYDKSNEEAIEYFFEFLDDIKDDISSYKEEAKNSLYHYIKVSRDKDINELYKEYLITHEENIKTLKKIHKAYKNKDEEQVKNMYSLFLFNLEDETTKQEAMENIEKALSTKEYAELSSSKRLKSILNDYLLKEKEMIEKIFYRDR